MRRRIAVALCCLGVTVSGCGASTHRDARQPAPSPAPAVRADFTLPALEIFGASLGFNAVGRRWKSDGSFDVTPSSIRRNWQSKWLIDEDPFEINQLGHPYQGATYHGIARSAGLNYWQALGYVFTASALWELAGEATPPSINDQIVTGLGGTFLGEALFRTANRLLADSDGAPKAGRRWLIAALSPPVAVNRLVFGRRFDGVMATRDPLMDIRNLFGAQVVVHGRTGSVHPAIDALLDVSVEYGLPDKAEYPYTRPFDYFHLRAAASTTAGMERLAATGLMAGRRVSAGANFAGVWGLFGGYDYLSPEIFRLSTTSLSIGATTSLRLKDAAALRVSALGGAGFGAAEALDGPADPDYHYGVGPHASAAIGLVSDRLTIDASAQGYLIGNIASFRSSGRDAVLRAEASAAWRVRGRHAVTVRYQVSHRTASNPRLGTTAQTRGTLGVFYTVLGSGRASGASSR